MIQSKNQTNTEFVSELMDFSNCGALMQLFILSAIEKYADSVIKAGPAACHSEMIHGGAWVSCAEEAKEAFNTRK